jgi:hypothetical protein
MRTVTSHCRLTRIVTGECNVEVAQLQAVLQRIQAALHAVPAAQRDYVAKALLSEAARRIAERGRAGQEK